MKLPARCYVQLHTGDYLTNDLAKPSKTPEVECEVTAAVATDPGTILISPVGSDVYFRVDRVLARDLKFAEAVGWKKKSDGDADSGWQHAQPLGPYGLFTGDSVDGARHGVVYTVTFRDKDGQLFR